MADTTFVNYQSPPIYAEWLNDVNNYIYKGRNPYFAVATMPTPNTYVLTFPAGSQYMPIYGDTISFAVPTANTGSSTLSIITSVQTVGPYNITQGGAVLLANALMPGVVYQATFNGSGFSIPIVGAPLSNPAFTGVPTAPTAAPGTNTTQIANTSFVTNALSSIPTGHGQVRLTKSGANLLLSPYNGRALIINGTAQMVPAAGITLAPTGLVVSTLYYIYAYMNAGVMTLEASTTGHSSDANTGVEIKTGDATRTLVGMAYPVTGPSFQDIPSQRYVVSYFNQRLLSLELTPITGTTTSTTYVEIGTRIGFLTWAANSLVDISVQGSCSMTATGVGMFMNLRFDGVSGAPEQAYASNAVAGSNTPYSLRKSASLSEGFHYGSLFIYSTSGSATATIATTSFEGYVQG